MTLNYANLHRRSGRFDRTEAISPHNPAAFGTEILLNRQYRP
jgi:hypothetical protein